MAFSLLNEKEILFKLLFFLMKFFYHLLNNNYHYYNRNFFFTYIILLINSKRRLVNSFLIILFLSFFLSLSIISLYGSILPIITLLPEETLISLLYFSISFLFWVEKNFKFSSFGLFILKLFIFTPFVCSFFSFSISNLNNLFLLLFLIS